MDAICTGSIRELKAVIEARVARLTPVRLAKNT
jgi:hypothetical protein